jgi:4-azaleucine resistance transporter AzlC
MRTEIPRFRAGVAATMPLAPGIAAFGLLYGMMARQVGLSSWEALAMSIMVHAGSAQFVALGMWNTSSAASVVLATLVVNLRHLLMGASVAPYLRDLGGRWKALLALWMSDESYALAISAYQQGQGSHWYFLGCNVGVCCVWWASGLLGCSWGMPSLIQVCMGWIWCSRWLSSRCSKAFSPLADMCWSLWFRD